MRMPAHAVVLPDELPCPVEAAARIIGRKWTLQIVHRLLIARKKRFCELQEELGGVNPSTLSSRLKMLEDEGLVMRDQVSSIPPHVEYSLTTRAASWRRLSQKLPVGASAGSAMMKTVLAKPRGWRKRWFRKYI